MTFESWIALVLALTLLGLSPGPAWAAVVTTGMARGPAAAAAMALGVALGDVVFVLAAVFGLALLAQALGTLFLAVKFAGAAYLIWLGVKLWRRPPSLAAPPKPSALGPFLGGFALTIGNPKVIAFYLGFLPAFMDLTALSGQDVGVLAATAFVVIFALLAGYGLAAAGARRLLARERLRRAFGRLLGTTLIATGVAVATR
ncbi:MAG: LysE family translocator [Pseudomonadota bacterium]